MYAPYPRTHRRHLGLACSALHSTGLAHRRSRTEAVGRSGGRALTNRGLRKDVSKSVHLRWPWSGAAVWRSASPHVPVTCRRSAAGRWVAMLRAANLRARLPVVPAPGLLHRLLLHRLLLHRVLLLHGVTVGWLLICWYAIGGWVRVVSAVSLLPVTGNQACGLRGAVILLLLLIGVGVSRGLLVGLGVCLLGGCA